MTPFRLQFALLIFFFMLYLGCVYPENTTKTGLVAADHGPPCFSIVFIDVQL